MHAFRVQRLSSNHAYFVLSQPLSDLHTFFATVDNKRIVFSQSGPWPMRHFAKVHEPPVGDIRLFQSEIVSHCRGDIEASALIQIGFRTFIAKHVLPMIGSEGSCVFPLRISDSIAFTDRDPSVLASRNSRTLVRLLKPRNNARRLRPVASTCFIVVGKCAVKWVLLWYEFYRDIITPMDGIWIVKTTVVFGPLFVPGTCAIRGEIIPTWQFPDPKNGCYDICFPRKRSRRPRG